MDNDGDTDLLLLNNSGPVRLLINRIGYRQHWLGLRLLDRNGRDAPGARVELHRADGSVLWRRVRADGSYASSNDPRVLFGLGDSAKLQSLRVHWPDAQVEGWVVPGVDRYLTLRQGQGSPGK